MNNLIRMHLLAARDAQILEEILYYKSQNTRSSGRLDFLHEEAEEAEREINKIMVEDSNAFVDASLKVNKELIPAEIADYCFRNFSLSSIIQINRNREYGSRALESAPLVKSFTNAIINFKGNSILSARESHTIEMGIINEPCVFNREGTFRNLYVPIKDYTSFEETRKENNKIYISPDFFNLRSMDLTSFVSGGLFLGTDYKEYAIPGGIPENIYIYLGNNLVERKLIDFEQLQSLPA